MQRAPLWGSDLRALVSVYRRPTAQVRADSRGWGDFTHALSALVPDFPAVCEREKEKVENYTVLVAPARPMHPVRAPRSELSAEECAEVDAFRRAYSGL